MPVYNEERLIESSVGAIHSFLRMNFQDYEMIIIESGSSDGSAEAADRAASALSGVSVVHEGAKNGFGSAIKIGYEKAVKDLVWLITPDMPFPLDAIHAALPLLDRYDCVLSYRSHDNRNMVRRAMSLGYNFLVKLLMGLPMRHVNSAFKVLKADAIRGIRVASNNWLFDAELLYRLMKKGASFIEIPVPLIDRREGRSSIRFSSIISALKEMAFFLKNRALTEGAR